MYTPPPSPLSKFDHQQTTNTLAGLAGYHKTIDIQKPIQTEIKIASAFFIDENGYGS